MVGKAWLFSLGMAAAGIVLSLLVVGIIRIIYKILKGKEAPEANTE